MRTILAIAALLVTAGCLGVGAPATDSPEPTPADGFPPGVTDDGVENASKLLDAHYAALAESGYAFHVESDSTCTENGSYTGRVKDGTFSLHAEYVRGEQAFVVDTWANDSVVLQRTELGNDTRYDQRQRHDAATEPWRTKLERILEAGDFAVTDRYVADRHTLLVLEANQTRTDHGEAFQAFDARAVVDLDGRVHGLNATTVPESQCDPQSHTLDYELTDVGIESVERPDWSDRAESAVAASLSLDSDREQIVLQHEAGDPLPEGTTVELTHDNETHTLTLDRSLEHGERAYISFPADGGAPVLSFEEPSGDFARIEGEYGVTVTGPDGASILNVGFAVETGSAEAPDA